MNEYDIKRLIEMEAIKAEIEGRKIANKESEMLNQPPAYGELYFYNKAKELRILAAKHNEQL